MDKKFLAFLRSLPTIAQNMRLNISLEGWPVVSAICAAGLLLIGVGATFASAKAEDDKGDKIQGREEPSGESQQDNSDVPTEGSSDEMDDPFIIPPRECTKAGRIEQ